MSEEKGRSRAYSRKMSIKKALRKKRLAKEVGGIEYDNLHQYSKNKIHCSCSSCSPKTKQEIKHSDAKKLSGMNNQEEEFTP